VIRVPELGGDEELFAFDHGRDDFLETLAHFFLVTVSLGEIDVAITILHGDLDLVIGQY